MKKGKLGIERKSFPWSSKSARRFADIVNLTVDWKFTLHAKDETERELFARAIAPSLPFAKLNCVGLNRQQFEAAIFGTFELGKARRIKSKPGICDRIKGGILLIDNCENLDSKVQIFLAWMIDKKCGEQIGQSKSETRPIDFKIIFGFNIFDGCKSLVEKLHFRLGIPHSLPSMLERKQDLVPVFRSGIKIFETLDNNRWQFDESFWQMLSSREWPFELYELVKFIRPFFYRYPDRIMSWSDFISVHATDFSRLVEERDKQLRLKVQHENEKIIGAVKNAKSRIEVMRAIDFLLCQSWQDFEQDFVRRGLTQDAEFSEKIESLPMKERNTIVRKISRRKKH